MRRIAVISAILEEPALTQSRFNEVVSEYKHLVRGRMGLPFEQEGIAAITIVVDGEQDEINALTGKLGRIEHIQIKTSFSAKNLA